MKDRKRCHAEVPLPGQQTSVPLSQRTCRDALGLLDFRTRVAMHWDCLIAELESMAIRRSCSSQTKDVSGWHPTPVLSGQCCCLHRSRTLCSDHQRPCGTGGRAAACIGQTPQVFCQDPRFRPIPDRANVVISKGPCIPDVSPVLHWSLRISGPSLQLRRRMQVREAQGGKQGL